MFGVTLDVEPGLTAISNGPEVERSDVDGRTVIRFADTMVMSSYLVAFVVGRLETSDTIDVNGIPLRIVHVPGKGHLTEFGLDVGAFSLRWFEEYYGIKYPSEKVDLVALPDFSAGAMENLGCITFRENLLLLDPATSTQNERESVADVVSHELAHMWFGDLVTMRWWNGIWLNEAFATFMEIAACDAYRPDWDRWTSFGLERTRRLRDRLARQHPPGRVRGAVTRRLRRHVRRADLPEGRCPAAHARAVPRRRPLPGRRQPLPPHAFVRQHRDERSVGRDRGDVRRAGPADHGLVDLAARLPDRQRLVDRGRRRLDGAVALPTAVPLRRTPRARRESLDDSLDRPVWAIPVHIRNGGVTTSVLLDEATLAAPVTLADPDGPVIVNAGGHGFFRVDYADDLRSRLDAEVLASMTTLERYNLVDDAWSSTLAGRLSAVELLEFLDGFRDEPDHAVWQAMAIALRGLGRIVGDDATEAFQARVRSLVVPALERVGEPAEGESDLTSKLRGLLVGAAGVLGNDVGTQARCREWYDAASRDATTVDPELAAAATSVIASTGDVDTYDQMLDALPRPGRHPRSSFATCTHSTEFDDEALLMRTCEFAMSDDVKTQNAPFVLAQAIGNRHHGAAAWAFVRDHWDEANERFPTNTIVRMVSGVRLLNTPEAVDDAESFFATHPIEQAAKTLEQILERQRVNAALRTRDADALGTYLTS